MAPNATPSSVFAISDAELKRLLPLAIAGDCKSAFTISRHHTFWTRQYEDSVKWLRIAARCDDVGVKSELILILINDELEAGTIKEIDGMLAEIRALDIPTAEEYEKLVASRREQRNTKKPGDSPSAPR